MPRASEQLIQRFAELHARGSTIRVNVGEGGSTPHADPESFYAWSSSALNAIEGAFGVSSAHAQNFRKELAGISNNLVWERKFQSIRGIFLGAKTDVDGGYIFDLQRSMSGEISVRRSRVALETLWLNHLADQVRGCVPL